MKLWKTAGTIVLVAAATPAFAAAGQKVESAETGLTQIEPRSAIELRASANDQVVRSDAVKWSAVWGSTVPKATWTGAGDPVRAELQTIDVSGRS